MNPLRKTDGQVSSLSSLLNPLYQNESQEHHLSRNEKTKRDQKNSIASRMSSKSPKRQNKAIENKARALLEKTLESPKLEEKDPVSNVAQKQEAKSEELTSRKEEEWKKKQSETRKKVLKDSQEKFIENAQLSSRRLSISTKTSKIRANQQLFIDTKSLPMKGEIYVHPRDKEDWEKIKSIKGEPINAFLPGYATGDRYTAILTMLVEPRLRVSVAYENGKEKDKKNALEAYDSLQKALLSQVNREDQQQAVINEIDKRVSLLSFDGESLKSARESLDEKDTREKFTLEQGGMSPLLATDTVGLDNHEHVFHISITTAIMAEHWEGDFSPEHIAQKAQEMRDKIYRMIPDESKKKLDAKVDALIQDKKIEKGSIGLWIANRPEANAREAEALSNPNMFELIQKDLEDKGKKVFYLADGYENMVNGKKENRYPFFDTTIPAVWKFWDDKETIKTREDQWYFVDQLLQKTESKALIGIRSGALETFALLGHNVIYLEHDKMFTPERHASWQGVIPYNRLVTEQRTGYFDAQTEIQRDALKSQLLDDHLREKQNTWNERRQEFDGEGNVIEELSKRRIDVQADSKEAPNSEQQIVEPTLTTPKKNRQETSSLTRVLENKSTEEIAKDIDGKAAAKKNSSIFSPHTDQAKKTTSPLRIKNLSLENKLKSGFSKLEKLDQQISAGVMDPDELVILHEMVETGLPAFAVKLKKD